MRKINKIILHCTDSDLAAHDNIETIRRWHVLENGWDDIGYHWVITKDGIYSGRPEHIPGAHCVGHNHDSIGVALTGRHIFSELQYEFCARLALNLLDKYNLGIEAIDGHNKYNKEKTCPNFPKENVIKRIYGPPRR